MDGRMGNELMDGWMDETGYWSSSNAAGKLISAAFIWDVAFKLQVSS